MLKLKMNLRWPKASLVLALLGVAAAIALGLASTESAKPDLKRLYGLTHSSTPGLPVILIPGVFGSKLSDPGTGEELWPGAWHRLLFSSYADLALEINPATLTLKPSRLVTTGIAEHALQQDFYRPILKTLIDFGGYVLTTSGAPLQKNEHQSDQRRLYVFAYDWRLDIVDNVRALDQLVSAIQKDYGNPAQQVNIVAHSMGGLIARYYLRHGSRDVLDGMAHTVSMAGAKNVNKLMLLGTPNLGSVSSLHAFIAGEKVVWNRIAPQTLATFPSGYQLFPHPLNTWLVDADVRMQHDDLFDPKTWQKFGWSVFDKTQLQGADTTAIALKQKFFAYQLERSRRLAWMLSVEEPVSPVRYALFGGGCHPTPARLLLERSDESARPDVVRLHSSDISKPKPGIDYDALMTEPGDGRVTKPSLLARESLDPGAAQNEDSFLPVAYSFFLCEGHTSLTSNINFQDNLLNALLSQSMAAGAKKSGKR